MSNIKKQETPNLKKISFEQIVAQDLQLNTKYDVDPVGFAVWIRALHQNWRQGTVGCKTRSEVAFSNRKPWKQKGTGRARAGSLRSPIWRKGGITFGPQPRVRTLKVNKELKKRVLNNILWDLLENKRVFTVDWQVGDKPKASQAFNLLKSNNVDKSKVALLIDKNNYLARAAFSNLKNVKILLFDQLNAFDLSSIDALIVFKNDLNKFKDMVQQCI